MEKQSLYFTGEKQVQLRNTTLSEPGPGEALVQSLFSAISPGTELLIYRSQFPPDMAMDTSIAALSGSFAYPFQYGYSMVGKVIATGAEVEPGWLDRLVFAFQPHENFFVTPVKALIPLPAGIDPQQAIFLSNMETAVSFTMDAAPLIGEQVAIFGQGIVGLLTTALLALFPLAGLLTFDRYPLRRQASLDAGAHWSLDPDSPDVMQVANRLLPGGADLVGELSGAPQALNQALALTRFSGRLLVGSWYGRKPVTLDLGGSFHRSRIRVLSSQVSTLAPELTGRWDKTRRFAVTWEMIRRLRPTRWITHRFPFVQAAKAYQLIDEQPEDTIQVILDYT